MRLFSCAALAALLLACPLSSARACGSGGGGGDYSGVLAVAAAVVIVGGSIDVGFSVADLAHLSEPEPRTPAYGAAELLLTGPQAALFAYGTFSGGCGLACGVLAAWTGTLAIHGIYTIVHGRPALPPPPPERRLSLHGRRPLEVVEEPRPRPPPLTPTLSLAPTLFADREHQIPGVVALVRF